MLKNEIERIQRDLRADRFSNEAAVSQGIVLPILQSLGWPVFDTQAVAPEYVIESRRVDFALCDLNTRPRVFLEVKRVGQAEGTDRQLFEYAFHRGVPMAVLTDGQEWSFYLPGEEGHYEERRVYKLDLLERTAQEGLERLTRYLAYTRIMSGDALQAARDDYKDAARHRQIETSLPKAWSELLNSQDSLLLELLADKVEDLCGYKPDLESCGRFLTDYAQAGEMQAPPVPISAVKPSRRRMVAKSSISSGSGSIPSVHSGFSFEGTFHPSRSARAVMQGVLHLLSERDRTFLDRFAARKHGKRRRFIARDRMALYPGRPDLCETHAVELIPGWWMGTNYSRRSIKEIIQLASEVAGVRFGIDLQVNLDSSKS